MRKRITLSGKNIEYTLRRSRGSRMMRLTVQNDGTLVATMPRWLGVWQLENFLRQKARWILEKLNAPRKLGMLAARNRSEYLELKEKSRQFVKKKIFDLNCHYNFSFERISIRDQKTRWGSCSKKGNLNFSYKLILLPEELADYIIVHELCHLREFNHSSRFWKLVEMKVPNYKELRRELHKY